MEEVYKECTIIYEIEKFNGNALYNNISTLNIYVSHG